MIILLVPNCNLVEGKLCGNVTYCNFEVKILGYHMLADSSFDKLITCKVSSQSQLHMLDHSQNFHGSKSGSAETLKN